MSLSRVPGDEELYIGGIFTLNRRAALQAAKITHIVSVLRYDFKDFKEWDKYEHCLVEVDDVEDENLLGEFPRTGKFIMEGLQGGGGVLVHCAMGRSRSVTVAIAYLLSTRPQTCPDIPSALALIQETRPMAEPNSGFMAQLELYKTMGCPSDIDSHSMYQRWLYRLEVELSVAVGRAPERLRFEDEEQEASSSTAAAAATGTSSSSSSSSPSSLAGNEEGEGQKEKEKQLRCRKCRRVLATSQYLIPHTPKSSSSPLPPARTAAATAAVAAMTTDPNQTGPIASLPLTTTTNTTSPPPPCTHHFTHPLSWMRPALATGALAGRLECPNATCRLQVGRYAWQGLKCSCGNWVVPGFSLAGGKVDVVSVGSGGVGGEDRKVTQQQQQQRSFVAGVRMPPLPLSAAGMMVVKNKGSL